MVVCKDIRGDRTQKKFVKVGPFDGFWYKNCFRLGPMSFEPVFFSTILTKNLGCFRLFQGFRIEGSKCKNKASFVL